MPSQPANSLVAAQVSRIISFPESVAVVLHAGTKRFLIFVGHPEIEAIKRELRGEKIGRPLTHDVITYILTGFDIEVSKVVISSIVNSIYCATLVLSRSREDQPDLKNEVRLDIRASDAMILALKTRNTIWVTPEVLEAVEDVSEALEQLDRQFGPEEGGADEGDAEEEGGGEEQEEDRD